MNAGDELITTEIIFAGVLAELTPEEAVAVLSALVFQVTPKCTISRKTFFPNLLLRHSTLRMLPTSVRDDPLR